MNCKDFLRKIGKNWQIVLDLLFMLTVIFLLYACISLIFQLPPGRPYGGPDEPMHRSMAEYIAKYNAWPHWNSTEILRYKTGVSYATGSSIVYWLHAISYKMTGMHRWGSFALLLVYLTLLAVIYLKDRIIGLIGLALTTPQVLFIFSYVNSDVETVIVALVFGLSMRMFINHPEKNKYLYFFFAMAGACITARQHMWAIGFLGFVYALLRTRHVLFKRSKRVLLTAVSIALVIASWWFITSYFANDGDIWGRFASKKATAIFAEPGSPSLAVDYKIFPIKRFVSTLLKSFYGVWGWMLVETNSYRLAYMFLITIFTLLLYAQKREMYFYIFCLFFNVSLMIFVSITYDYQAQGRYMFPGFFMILGMSLNNFQLIFKEKRKLGLSMLILSIILIAINIYSISTLAQKLPGFD